MTPQYTHELLEYATERQEIEVLVEVDVATARPPAIHAKVYTWLVVERVDRNNVLVEANLTAMLMAMCHPHVVMAVGSRIVDWREPERRSA